MFDRWIKLIGEDQLLELKKISVLIVGLGGVGGYAAEALARSGIGKLILVDFDVVDESNKNRQLIALDSVLGRKKVELFQERIKEINCDCQVVPVELFLKEERVDELLDVYHPEFVLDACDTVSTKKGLIRSCMISGIPILSSMGTGNRLDPSKIEITELRKTEGDPIAKVLRKWVKDEHISSKVAVVWSRERPLKTFDRTPGSSAFVPSAAGLLMASWVVDQKLNHKITEKV